MRHEYPSADGQPRDRGLAALLADIVKDAARLGAQEMALFRAELSDRTSRMVGGIVLLGVAAVLAIIALSLAVEALVDWLAIVLNSELAAVLICAAGAGVLALIFYLAGRSRLNPKNLTPDRSVDSVSEDIALITKRL